MEETKENYVKLTYFKSSGKYYCEGSYFSKLSLSYDVYNEVKEKNYYGTLPDLDSGAWYGFILVVADDGVPHIIDKAEYQGDVL